MSVPWMKFYPRDWLADQALRTVSLAGRGLWMDMLCIMHSATPYGHLLIAGQPVGSDGLARLVGASAEEVQALLVDLGNAEVFRRTRTGVIYSKRMTDDYKRSIQGRKDKLEGLDKTRQNYGPSRGKPSPPTTQKAEARGKVEATRASTLPEAKNNFIGPKEVRDAFLARHDEGWVHAYVDPCGWQDVPDRALIPATRTGATKLVREGRAVLSALGLIVLERAA